MHALRLLTAAALLAVSGPAAAGPTVSLNGVNIDGVTSQRFENATVVIDEQGNIDIVAKGYSVATGEASSAPAPGPLVADGRPPPGAPLLTRRYYLVGEQSELDGTQYDIAVFINGRWIKELRSADEPRPFEVTRFLQPGPNKVVLVATKRVRLARRSTSPGVTFRVVLGEAAVTGDRVAIESPQIEMKRNAAETETFTQEYALVAR
jgi:hypothetical protein